MTKIEIFDIIDSLNLTPVKTNRLKVSFEYYTQDLFKQLQIEIEHWKKIALDALSKEESYRETNTREGIVKINIDPNE